MLIAPFQQPHPSPQVQAEVNSEIARLVAWSMGFASTGQAPTSGFYGEMFPKSTYRCQMAGKELAHGWKILT